MTNSQLRETINEARGVKQPRVIHDPVGRLCPFLQLTEEDETANGGELARLAEAHSCEHDWATRCGKISTHAEQTNWPVCNDPIDQEGVDWLFCQQCSEADAAG
jgi:hypothetical protein